MLDDGDVLCSYTIIPSLMVLKKVGVPLLGCLSELDTCIILRGMWSGVYPRTRTQEKHVFECNERDIHVSSKNYEESGYVQSHFGFVNHLVVLIVR